MRISVSSKTALSVSISFSEFFFVSSNFQGIGSCRYEGGSNPSCHNPEQVEHRQYGLMAKKYLVRRCRKPSLDFENKGVSRKQLRSSTTVQRSDLVVREGIVLKYLNTCPSDYFFSLTRIGID